MITRLKLDDEEELQKLVNELGIPFIELSYVEFDISSTFYKDDYRDKLIVETDYVKDIELVNQDNCILTLTDQDKVYIINWILNYKNIDEILSKLWGDYETARKTS